MAIEFCKCCSAKELVPLWLDRDGGQWLRCSYCGGDSADRTEADVAGWYDRRYLDVHLKDHAGGSPQAAAERMTSNLDWFHHHRDGSMGWDFLDVGHCEGGALYGMQERGYKVHGFDVNPACDYGPHTTIAPLFHAGLFPRRYDAVLCREVLEHVPGWRQLLVELFLVTKRGGLVQVQTPRPCTFNSPIAYQFAHLQLLTPVLLRWELERVGFTVLDSRVWDIGQAVLLHRAKGD